MQALNREHRRSIGCGFEAPLEGATPWQPPSVQLGYRNGEIDVCAGFLARLPEVQEAGRAHLWWTKGQLLTLLGKEELSELLKERIEIIETESARARICWMTPKKEGGMRGD